MKLTGIDSIIFDLDGTLIDSSKGIALATNYALSTIGDKERPVSEIKKYIGYPLEDMFAAFSDGNYDDFLTLFQQKAREVMVDTTYALDGAEDVLRHFNREGKRLAIGSTKISVHIEGIIKKMQWGKYISVTVGADQVDQAKPAPDIFLKAIDQLQTSKDKVVVVGDTINDIKAAQAAGLRCIAVKSLYGGEAELKKSRPDYMVENIKDILALF